MALTSSSTLAEIVAAYVDNADWFEEQSLAKAKLFANALRVLLVKRPAQSDMLRFSIRWDLGFWDRQLTEVTRWIQSHPDFTDASSAPVMLDLSRARQ